MIKNEYFKKDTENVARGLVGCTLCIETDSGTERFVITETEAYLGPEDTASHARFGKTTRSQMMYKKPGTLYVYLVYGMHHMLNIVTGPAGTPGAVLIRGIRGADGPGKLTSQLGITKDAYNGKRLGKESGIWIESRPDDFSTEDVRATPRVGIDYADREWRERPLRFTWSGE